MTSFSAGGDDGDHRSLRPEHLILTKDQQRAKEALNARILGIESISPTVKSFTLSVEGDTKNASFKAGQWVDFYIPGIDKVGGFSMCSSPQQLKESGTLELAIKDSTWPPADWLHRKARVGDKVEMVVGGNFFYPNHVTEASTGGRHNLLLLAGGVGINPLMSIVRHIFHNERNDQETLKVARNVTLLFSAKTPEEWLFSQKLEEISKDHPNFKCRFFETSPSSPRSSARITREDLGLAIRDMNGEDFPDGKVASFCFICGPTPMIRDMDRMAQEEGIPQKNIFYELWW